MNYKLMTMVAAVAGSLLAACGSNDDPNETAATDGSVSTAATDEVTLVLDWTPNTNHGGIYLALDNGWYEQAGIDLTIIQPGEGGSLQAVATGNAEFAISVQEELVPARASDVPVVSIAAIVATNTSSMLSLADAGITRPADFADRLYGGWGGQLERALIDRLVACDGGDPAAVEMVEVGNTDFRVGLESGAFDYVWVYEGWDRLRFEQAGVEVTTVPFADYLNCIPNWYTPLIATSETMIANDPVVVQRFMDATARGYRAAMGDPSAAADALLAAAPELDAELVRASAEYLSTHYAATPDAWGAQDPEVWSGFVEFLVEAELLTEPIALDEAYTNTFTENATPTETP